MADYTRWWQYIVILTVVGFIVFLVFQLYFVYVPIERIEGQVYHTTDLLNDAAATTARLEAKIDATLTILEPLVLPIAIFTCTLVCGATPVISPTCPTATFEFCLSIAPTGMTGATASPPASTLLNRVLPTTLKIPPGPTGVVGPATMGFYMRNQVPGK